MHSVYFDKDQLTQCVKALRGFGCCPRCCLRLAGVIEEAAYRKNDEELSAMIELVAPEATGNANDGTESVDGNGSEVTLAVSPVCCLCLGVLQAFCQDEFIAQVCDAVVKSGHEFTLISCGLTLPVATIVREHAVKLSLDEKLQEIINKNASSNIVTTVKEAWKYACCKKIEERLHVPFQIKKSPFEVLITWSQEGLTVDLNFLSDVFPRVFRKRSQNQSDEDVFTRNSVIKHLGEISHQKFRRLYPCPPQRPETACKIDSIGCCQDPIHIGGRYNKYSRTLSQSPWMVDGERRAESSVSELIADPLKEFFKADSTRFTASGREDVDVVMLGTGRPFAVELINAHRVKVTDDDILRLQQQINGSSTEIAVRHLQVVAKDTLDQLKQGEEEKTKTYEAICWCQRPLTPDDYDKMNNTRDLDLQQKTPIRVLHRRPVATRLRRIYNMNATEIDANHFRMILSTQAGTYVKEFVHGDFGRTKPNICTLLGAECDILELSVLNVELDWPPKQIDA